jgi:hypothetical protein
MAPWRKKYQEERSRGPEKRELALARKKRTAEEEAAMDPWADRVLWTSDDEDDVVV